MKDQKTWFEWDKRHMTTVVTWPLSSELPYSRDGYAHYTLNIKPFILSLQCFFHMISFYTSPVFYINTKKDVTKAKNRKTFNHPWYVWLIYIHTHIFIVLRNVRWYQGLFKSRQSNRDRQYNGPMRQKTHPMNYKTAATFYRWIK
jgi:hypothetical protein